MFLAVGYSLCYFVSTKCSNLVVEFHKFFPIPHIGKSIIALLIGLILPLIINIFYRKWRWVKNEIQKYGDHLDELLMRAFEEEKLVQLTMSNGKVYVGRTLQAFEPLSEYEYIKILPVQSGFREPIKHKVTFTTNYTKAYWKHLEENPSDIQVNSYRGIVLSVSEIVVASFFDQDLYNTFNKLPTMHQDAEKK
ncbi:hypothetical protein DRQ25_13925 [Candidatus Fermentibacteria bacterium]|nr:MAG: hypothetical protein DRQ25_13925 [Candidatus Fermentibacteria bacterium]